MTEEEIIAFLLQSGPLTGAQLAEFTRMEALELWRACHKSTAIHLVIAGERFLRLDRVVQGYARLSPSIRREFLTYTLVGLKDQRETLQEKAEALWEETKQISQAKLALAKESAAASVESLPDRDTILKKACFIIAGDIVYEMSHKVPRPEKSTGKMVQGSDMDIIVVVEDDLDLESIRSLDKSIHKRKHFLLVHPLYREEIDYLIKSLSRVREQLKFDTFESMIACKILHEGQFLYGSSSVYHAVKDLVIANRIPERLKDMEQQAATNRNFAERRLVEMAAEEYESDSYNLFYTREEGDEIY